MANLKILVADDSLTIQKVIKLALANEGYEIQTVTEGAEALEMLSVFRPDIVLIDVALPTKTAIEIKREAAKKDDLKKVKFILMSSAFEQVDEDLVKSVHFDGRLVKPFDPALLRQTLAKVLGIEGAASAGLGTSRPIPPPPPGLQSKTGLIPAMPPNMMPSPPPVPSSNRPAPTAPSKLPINRPTAPPTMPSQNDEIKQLTEDTIKMSGLGDLQWDIHEPAKKRTESATKSTFFPKPTSTESTATPLPPATPKRSHEAHESSLNDSLENLKPEIEMQIRKAVQNLIPDIAEKIVKEEIQKLLSNPPS
jgi:CheY-like chemotaxis protein